MYVEDRRSLNESDIYYIIKNRHYNALDLNEAVFESNTGKYPSDILFTIRIKEGYICFYRDKIKYLIFSRCDQMQENKPLSHNERLSFQRRKKHSAIEDSRCDIHEITVKYINANSQVQVIGNKKKSEKIYYLSNNNFINGTDTSPFQEILYKNIYNGIDLYFKFENGRLKSEYHIYPYANYREINLRYSGVDSLQILDDGRLIYLNAGIKITENVPISYQIYNGKQYGIASKFIFLRNKIVSFIIDSYDHSIPLVIDPLYSTYFGGSLDEGTGSVCVDREGYIYISGNTRSLDLPRNVPSIQDSIRGIRNGYIAKFTPDAKHLVYSTYIGGSGQDIITAMKIDSSNNVIIAGYTNSKDFPTTKNAWKKQLGGEADAFVAKISSNGSSLIYSTYLGGSGYDDIFDIAIDKNGNVYAVGLTDSPQDFPRTLDAIQKTFGGGDDDMYLSTLDSSGSSILYSTFFGGNGFDEAYAIALDQTGKIFITGLTSSNDFSVTHDALQMQKKGDDEACIIILGDGGRTLLYSTYYGGSLSDSGEGVALDSVGNMYVFGRTVSRDLSTSKGVFQPKKSEPNGPNDNSIDSFILKFNPFSKQLLFCTYLGGEANDEIEDIILLRGFVLLGGSTTSSKYPVTNNALKKVKNGYFDMIFSIIDPSASTLIYSTYFGGSGSDFNSAISLTRDNKLVFAGPTTSEDFPVSINAYQKSLAGGNDAFILIIPIEDVISNIPSQYTGIPNEFQLFQNYPNPFGNGGTSIDFSLYRLSSVSLYIYDALGREIQKHQWRNLEQGKHTFYFQSLYLQPGFYTYGLDVNGSIISKRMLKLM